MRCNPRFPRCQRGAILVVSLLLLLVMTVLALTASQTTRLQERMASNSRDLDLSFQATEATLRVGEKWIADNKDREDVYERPDTEALQPAKLATSWWADNATGLGKNLYALSAEPQYYIEERGKVPDALSVGSSLSPSGTMYYQTTARANGATDTAVTIVVTTFAVRY